MQNDANLLRFTLNNVLEAIHQEEPMISAVYITLDEFQTTTQWLVPCENTNIGTTATEPLSRSLARALAEAARMAGGKFFVFGTLVGTSIAAEDIVSDTTDDTFARVAVQRLTSQNVRNIINRMTLHGHAGADWLALKGFDALIKIVAGIPRTVELLVQQMSRQYTVLPASIDIQHWRSAIFSDYEIRFNTAAVFGKAAPKTWPLLLGAAGYNVSSLNVIAGTREAPLTLQALEKVGFFTSIDKPLDSAWERYYLNCHSERAVTVLDVPMPLLAMMTRVNNLEVHCPDPPRKFTEHEIASLKNLLRPLVVDIDVNPEKVTLAHFLLRWNIFNFADSNKYVLAADLFIGGTFNPEFGTLQFVKEKKVIELINNPARGVWATITNEQGMPVQSGSKKPAPPSVTESVDLTHGAVLKFSDMSVQSRGVIFGRTNLFDSHVRLWVREGRKKRIAIVWLDVKHIGTGSTDLTPNEVAQVVEKRKFLQKKLPQYLHLAVIYSNREYEGIVPADPYTCIVAKDGMAFSLSPFMKWLLVDNA